MKIISNIQPLIFSFSNTDKLMDAIYRIKTADYKTALSRFKEVYYLTVYSPLSKRADIKRGLSEYGTICGKGVILDAYIAEHGARISSEVDFKAFI